MAGFFFMMLRSLQPQAIGRQRLNIGNAGANRTSSPKPGKPVQPLPQSFIARPRRNTHQEPWD
ncbi:hypothetical protein CK220_21635 [Mesorhizobium sp. WSM3860]|nr:hypothetical protein CK220_21635 [Mesorhizobium sp. WSM3860]